MSYYYQWKPYVPVAVRRAQAEKIAAKAAKKGAALRPVRASGNKIAATFWGRAWCDNLERYSDYSNRLPRGRTYLRNGSVIDLAILQGEVRAQVAGSSLYRTVVKVGAVPPARWRAICAECAGSIDSVVELLQGRLSQAVMARICKPGTGLFPAPAEIEFECSCPDWAAMCKHVAAVLYGVGVRLDEAPDLLFRLRGVDAAQLVAQAGAGLAAPRQSPRAARRLEDSVLSDVFGIDIAAPQGQPRVEVPPGKKAARRVKADTTPRKAVAAGRKTSGPRKTTASKSIASKTTAIKAAKKRSPIAPRRGSVKPKKPTPA